MVAYCAPVAADGVEVKERLHTPPPLRQVECEVKDEEEVDVDQLMQRLRHHVLVNRVRVKDHFHDFDPLNSGTVSRARFERGLASMGLSSLGQHHLTAGQSQQPFPFCSLAVLAMSHTRLHTHTHTPFNGPLSGTTQVSRYQKGKPNLDFTEARDSEWQWHQLGHMQVCTLFQTDTHASTLPLSFLKAGCPSCRPTNSVKALKARSSRYHFCEISSGYQKSFRSLDF